MGAKAINLALQGGGAHGAFTWGVLDRLLEDPRIEFEGISATSSGAMNAAVMANGLTVGGRDGAREALSDFWHGVAQPTAFWGPFQTSLVEAVSLFMSPYQFNLLNYNPLRRMSATSYFWRVMHSIASRPLLAKSARYPICCSSLSASFWFTTLSSTRRMRRGWREAS